MPALSTLAGTGTAAPLKLLALALMTTSNGPPGAARDAGEGTDFYVTERGGISLTPLQLDLTHAAQLKALQQALG